MNHALRQLSKILFLSALFCTFGVSAQATWLETYSVSDGSREKQHAADIEALRARDEMAAVRLLEFRAKVEKESYQVTMDLCYGYRMARGMGMPHQIDSVQATQKSAQAWAKIFYEGVAQPFSAIGGLKADYLLERNISLIAIDSWFRSLYTIYLIESNGFLNGATHCLNTLEHNDILNFASTILAFDLAGTAGMEFGSGLVAEAIIGQVAKVSNVFVIKPAWRLMQLMGVRRAHMIIGGLFIMTIGADNLVMYIGDIERGRDIALKLINGENKENEERTKRFLVLNRAYVLLKKAMALEAEGKDATAAAQEYKNFVAQQLSLDKRSAYLYDQGTLNAIPPSEMDLPKNKFNKVYFALLNLILQSLEL